MTLSHRTPDRWLTSPKILAAGQILCLAQATALVMLALFQHGLLPGTSESPTASDFVSFYAAGKLALAGTPALAYDQAVHFAVEQHFSPPGAPYQFFFYPPVFILLFAPIAALPYTLAFYLFEAATLAAFLLVVRRILAEPNWVFLPVVLAFPAIFWTVGLGQNAFLTAALFGGFTLTLRHRPGLAGGLLGLLCYKPHFGLLAPIALAAGGHWQAFRAAAATIAGLVALSTALFGVETWRAYLTAFAGSDAVYASGRIDYAGMITPFGAARLIGFAPASAYMLQITATLTMAALTAWTWRRARRGAARSQPVLSHPTPGRRAPNRPAQMALLLSATLLAVPMAILYDKMLLLVAIAWLARESRETGFSAGDKAILAGVYLISLLEYPVGAAWQVPLGPVATLAVLALAARRFGIWPKATRIEAVPAAAE